MILSLFCGAGGLDLGFENAGYDVGLALDRRVDSISSYNRNRPAAPNGRVQDIADLTLDRLDELHGERFAPTAVIGGPPCQSFSQANVNQTDDDPRHNLPIKFASIVDELNKRSALDFIAFENVVGLTSARHVTVLEFVKAKLKASGFNVTQVILNSHHYNTPQVRRRLFLVGINRKLFGDSFWSAPAPTDARLTVRDAIGGLPEPTHFTRGLTPSQISHHENHWCMAPKSPKFSKVGGLQEGNVRSRSFKTLRWDGPSITVAYGHREVHIHPDGKRRLSVFEAMCLQGFPKDFILDGNLSSQITQVSEAVPPPMAQAVAQSIRSQLATLRLRHAA